jgi:hypothetical protein
MKRITCHNPGCDNQFPANQNSKKYCSKACRYEMLLARRRDRYHRLSDARENLHARVMQAARVHDRDGGIGWTKLLGYRGND